MIGDARFVVFQDPSVTQVTNSSIEPVDQYNPFPARTTVRHLKDHFLHVLLLILSCLLPFLVYLSSLSFHVASSCFIFLYSLFTNPTLSFCAICIGFFHSYLILFSCSLLALTLLITFQDGHSTPASTSPYQPAVLQPSTEPSPQVDHIFLNTCCYIYLPQLKNT